MASNYTATVTSGGETTATGGTNSAVAAADTPAPEEASTVVSVTETAPAAKSTKK